MTDGSGARPAVRVRRARREEADALATLYLDARRSAPGVPPLAHDEADVRGWMATVVFDSCEVWVSVAAGTVTGLMALDGDCVEQLYVAADRRRAGSGSALVEHAQRSRSSLWLWTFLANRDARAFYERHGFRAYGEPSADNEERAPAIRYRWSRPRPRPQPRADD